MINEFLRRFGTSTFLKQLFQYYLDALVADYSQADQLLDDKSSTSSEAVDTAIATSAPIVVEEEQAKRSHLELIPKIAKVASEAFVGIW